MYEYENQNTSDQQQTYQYQSANIPTGSPAPEPRRPRHKKGSGSAIRIAKKAGAIALSAVLFGGVASGTFLAINHAAGYSASGNGSADAGETPAGTQEQTPSSLLKATSSSVQASSGTLDVSSVASSVMPSIVSITNKSVQEVQNYFSMFGYGGHSQQIESESVGSGIIIGKNDSELLIVTNYHVIQNADTLSASFIDNSVCEANLKGTDPDNDLAVIAVPLSSISENTMGQIKVATIGNSDALKVGEQVVAIGNALGYGQSVTTGIVSATNRTISTSVTQNAETVPSYIQTDAAINPGNSGGALVNMSGEVIGINSAKLASTEVEGMGYAIPVSRVSDIIETLMNETTRSKVAQDQQSALGISGLTVDASVTKAYGIPSGVYVAEITEGGSAQAAGIKTGDVITKFDGKTVSNIQELKDMLQYYAAGETVTVTVKTPGNANTYAEREFSVTLGSAAAAENTPETQGEPAGSGNIIIH